MITKASFGAIAGQRRPHDMGGTLGAVVVHACESNKRLQATVGAIAGQWPQEGQGGTPSLFLGIGREK